jgi:hypothetical protein
MKSLDFRATMKIYNANPYVRVSLKRAQALKAGWRKPMPVLIQVNGKPEAPCRTNMMPMGDGSFYLYLHGIIRKASGTNVGDKIKISVQFDDTYRNGPMHPMPVWFKKELDKNPRAKKSWSMLIPSRQKEILRYISGLKSQEAQVRNLQKALHVLSGNKGRFMARDWDQGK